MYFPREDSFFLSEEIKKYLQNNTNKNNKIKILDLGSGTGIQAETCLKLGFKNITASDINKEVIENLKKKKIKVIKSDLFEKIKDKFDLIIFNPPYLPEHKYDKEKDTSGGKFGDETILKFLKQAKSHLNNKGNILLLISSYTPKLRINKLIKKLNFKSEIIAEKKLFFEKLSILKLSF